MIKILITLALLLDSILTGITIKSVDISKESLYGYSEEISSAFVELNLTEKEIKPTIYFKNIPFRGSTLTEKSNYYRVCSSNIELSTKYKYKHNPLYGTPDIIVTLAHEMTHMYQGIDCGKSVPIVEKEATINDILVLNKLSDDDFYKIALLWQLRELAIIRAIDESCGNNESSDWTIKLSKQANELYGKVTCSTAKNRRFYTDALLEIMEYYPEIIENATKQIK